MSNNFNITIHKRSTSFFLAVLFIFLYTSGCSQNKNQFRVSHPGKYELIQMGKVTDGPGSYRAYKAHDKIFHAHPSVLKPTFFSLYLLEHTEIHEGESVLDIGTGTGIQAIFAAEKASHVLAMDISKLALENTMLNARRLGVSDKISVRDSDLFNALDADEKFDVIISSIPYAWNEKTQGNWKLHERFFLNVGKHLKPNGRIYFLTGALNNLSRTKELIEKNSLKIINVDMAYSVNQNLEPIVYVIKHTTAALQKSGLKTNVQK